MTLLRVAYVLNILSLIPVGPTMLFGGPQGQRRVFQGKYPDSAGMRSLLGSIWTAVLLGSVLGLLSPVAMSPILVIQVTYKALWWLVFVVPRLASGRSAEVHWVSAGIFLFMVVAYPWVIPWAKLFARRGDPGAGGPSGAPRVVVAEWNFASRLAVQCPRLRRPHPAAWTGPPEGRDRGLARRRE